MVGGARGARQVVVGAPWYPYGVYSEAVNAFSATRPGSWLVAHVAFWDQLVGFCDVNQARALRDLVQEQGREGAAGIVQGERALARLSHAVGGSHEGHGSRDQADVTPGEEPTRKQTDRGDGTGSGDGARA